MSCGRLGTNRVELALPPEPMVVLERTAFTAVLSRLPGRRSSTPRCVRYDRGRAVGRHTRPCV